jgi:hypothetical protein
MSLRHFVLAVCCSLPLGVSGGARRQAHGRSGDGPARAGCWPTSPILFRDNAGPRAIGRHAADAGAASDGVIDNGPVATAWRGRAPLILLAAKTRARESGGNNSDRPARPAGAAGISFFVKLSSAESGDDGARALTDAADLGIAWSERRRPSWSERRPSWSGPAAAELPGHRFKAGQILQLT